MKFEHSAIIRNFNTDEAKIVDASGITDIGQGPEGEETETLGLDHFRDMDSFDQLDTDSALDFENPFSDDVDSSDYVTDPDAKHADGDLIDFLNYLDDYERQKNDSPLPDSDSFEMGGQTNSYGEIEPTVDTIDDAGGDVESSMGPEGILDDQEETEDPNYQGIIRTVTGAFLVYKRKAQDGTFEELWIYNVGKNMADEVKIRRAILAGTDISPQDVSSEDGTQECHTQTVGNVQFLKITGLPN